MGVGRGVVSIMEIGSGESVADGVEMGVEVAFVDALAFEVAVVFAEEGHTGASRHPFSLTPLGIGSLPFGQAGGVKVGHPGAQSAASGIPSVIHAL